MENQDNQTPIRVLIADDQQIIQEGIATILTYQPGIMVVGKAANGQEAVEQCRVLEPDVVLMDIRMPILDGVAATRLIRQELPAVKVLVLTTFNDDEYVLAALRAGASGYLLKDIPGAELAQAIRTLHLGVYQLEPSVVARLLANLNQTAAPAFSQPKPLLKPDIDLTERELEILRLVAEGATNREIAQQLIITEGTVKNHVSNILMRLNLRDRTHAAIFARERGLI